MRERNLNQASKPPVSRGFIPVLSLLGALVLALSVPRSARARSGNSFLETMGISIAVGTVLGASTLPFYDQPGSHLRNLAYGASIGAAAGVGISLYHLFSGRSSEDYFTFHSYENAQRRDLLHLAVSKKVGNIASNSRSDSIQGGGGPLDTAVASPKGFARPVQLWMPIVSLTW